MALPGYRLLTVDDCRYYIGKPIKFYTGNTNLTKRSITSGSSIFIPNGDLYIGRKRIPKIISKWLQSNKPGPYLSEKGRNIFYSLGGAVIFKHGGADSLQICYPHNIMASNCMSTPAYIKIGDEIATYQQFTKYICCSKKKMRKIRTVHHPRRKRK